MSPDRELVSLPRSWISIDATWQKTVLDVDKHVIMHRVQIHTRDLRILDPKRFYPSAILGRERAIVFNLEEFQRRLPLGNEAHGAHADGDMGEENGTYPSTSISSRNLGRVRKLKSAMTRLTARVQKVRDELEQLLDDDGDMADLYLTRKLVGVSSSPNVSDEPIWYPTSPTIDSTLNKLNELREYINDIEDYINIQLDNHRNQLIQLELMLSSGTVCVSMSSMNARIFGMNIPNTWNHDHGYMFKWNVCTVLFAIILSYARFRGLIRS
ncbi:hypothetical protein CARUB_v10024534mg [Capsella rubella]|uniref:Magnesium transporter n=1 Tax=Capsella rubella TaxID=81985 RepID=R0HW78_9BRAS|nr:hypothetical protein CARUB_v10024534mg [Capsella rubella]